MKKLIGIGLFVAIIGLLSITAVAAEGLQEGRDGDAPAPAQNPYYNSEKLSVEGTVKLTISGVELKATDGKVYELMYPRFLAEGIEVEDGDTVAVEGYLVPGPRWESSEEENYLRVDKVTIDGEEYDLAAAFSPGSGPRSGMGRPGAGNPRGGYAGGYGDGYSNNMPGRNPGMMGGPGYRW